MQERRVKEETKGDGNLAKGEYFCASPLTSELDALFGANANPRLRVLTL